MMVQLFNKFMENEENLYKTKDCINGDCSIFALKLYDYYFKEGYEPNINMLNKGVHFWITIDNYFIDGRGVFKSQKELLVYFKKYVVKERISILERDGLKRYILNKKKA